MSIYYVYAYLRSKDSTTAPAGTPYYIGKGSNGRAFSPHCHTPVPSNKSNIVFLEENLTENKAFEIEKFLIAYYGRKDIGTGILLNRTNGGEGPSGTVVTEETRAKMSSARSGKRHPLYGKHHTSATKKKMSEALGGMKHPNYGKSHSDETKKKLSASLCGENNPQYGMTGENSVWFGKHHTSATKKKISATLSGRVMLEETRAKLSIINSGKIQPIVECPHCGKLGKGSVMFRWHFNNCKN